MATKIVNTAATTNATSQAKTEYKQYRDFNTFTAECRVQHVEVKSGQHGEFATVTAVTNLKDGEEGIAVRFSSSNGILKLAKAGHLMPGRRIHVSGNVSEFANAYSKDGVITALGRPRLQLQNATLMLGAKPRSAMAK